MFKRFCFVSRAVSFLVIVMLSACSMLYSKDDYVRDYRNFVIKVEKNYQKYSDAEWAAADFEYQKYSVEYYDKFRGELTQQDKYLIGRLNGIYNILRIKNEATNFLNQTKDILDQAKGFIDGASESINK